MAMILGRSPRVLMLGTIVLLAGCSSGAASSPVGLSPQSSAVRSSFTASHPATASDPSFQEIYKFKGGSEGSIPESALIYTNGKFYGTTSGIINHNPQECGSLFSLTPDPTFSTFKYRLLHSFTGSPDGCNPSGGLIVVGRNLYGVASRGGADAFGTIFSIPLGGGAIDVLHTFANTSDGGVPLGPLLNVGSALYGVAGTDSNAQLTGGEVFGLPLSGGSLSMVYAFPTEAQQSMQVARPVGGLIAVGNNLYGESMVGGSSGYAYDDTGTVFSVPLTGGSFTIVSSLVNGPAGSSSGGPLINVGNTLYGTTQEAVFSVPLAGGSETVLHAFSSNIYGTGGSYVGPLALIGSALYGETEFGGTFLENGKEQKGYGMIFSLPLAGGDIDDVYTFPRGNGGGYSPSGAVIEVNGSLYGTAAQGGYMNNGTVFKL